MKNWIPAFLTCRGPKDPSSCSSQNKNVRRNMKKQMIIAGLKARPVRTTVSVLAVALEVVLILVVVGLTTGITAETAKRTAGVGAEVMVQPPNSSMFLALATNTMPVALAEELRKLPAVQAVAPVQ